MRLSRALVFTSVLVIATTTPAIADVVVDGVERHVQRSGNPPRLERAGRRRPDVDDHRVQPGVDKTIQFIHGDLRHAQHREKAAPLPPFESDIRCQQRDDDNDGDASYVIQPCQEPFHLRPEQHPAADTRAHPEARAQGVEKQKLRPADARLHKAL